MRKLVLFIHGLAGDAAGTWQKFPALIEADPELNAQFDVSTFEYTTGFLAGKPSLALCGQSLVTAISNKYNVYTDITLIAHSQGGLIAKYGIAQLLMGDKPCRVKKLLTFATPHNGSGLAHPAKLMISTLILTFFKR
jgi:triacylglycerol esterase/lipase EstA (alpha/beta hydrolase family)